jgi:hypothetical protein
MIAPTADTGAHRLAHDPVPRNSDRDTMTEPGQHATPAMRLATAAGQGGTPAKMSAGYETSEVMPPAVPTRPAKAPATRRKMASVVEITVTKRVRHAAVHRASTGGSGAGLDDSSAGDAGPENSGPDNARS